MVMGNGHGDPSSNPLSQAVCISYEPNNLEKGIIQLFYLQIRVICRVEGAH